MIQLSGSKYVPPHLRKSQGSGGGSASNNYDSYGGDGGRRSYGGGGGGYGGGGGGYYSDRRGSGGSGGGYGRSGSYGDDRGGGGGGGYGGDRRQSYGPPQTNSRWANDGGGGGGDRRYSSGGGGGGGYRGGARKNERGFHGEMAPDKRLEARLFDSSGKQSTGINFDNYDKIPIEVSGENIPDPIETYSEETIGEDLFRNTELCGYHKPTPVQKYSVPIGKQGRDLMACAQTGSGKTAGFLFPIIMAMIRTGGRDPPESTGRRRTYPEALVLAPTRELAQQIYEEARRFTYCTGIAPVCVYGGADIRDQLRQIERQGCDLLVATPGRLVDFIERGRLGMENVQYLVLDEADRMLDMGFEVRIIVLLLEGYTHVVCFEILTHTIFSCFSFAAPNPSHC